MSACVPSVTKATVTTVPYNNDIDDDKNHSTDNDNNVPGEKLDSDDASTGKRVRGAVGIGGQSAKQCSFVAIWGIMYAR